MANSRLADRLRRWSALALLAAVSIGGLVLVAGLRSVQAAQIGSAPLQAPITALYADNERLLIGTGSSLWITALGEAAFDDVPQPRQMIDVGRGELRDLATLPIGVKGGFDSLILALSEDGLTLLDSAGQVLDFVPGGGQRLNAVNGLILVAAQQSGVRILAPDSAGKLALRASLDTDGPAFSADIDPRGRLWVAEGDSGARIYELTENAGLLRSTFRVALPDSTPAYALNLRGPWALVGGAETLDTYSLDDTPQRIARQRLDSNDAPPSPENARVLALAVIGGRAFAGRSSQEGGPDLLIVDLTADGGFRAPSLQGEQGDGAFLALAGDTLFVGGTQGGLRRLYLGRGEPAWTGTWAASSGRYAPCAPVDAPPASEADAMILRWKGCPGAVHEVWGDGTLLGRLDPPDPAIPVQEYRLAPDQVVSTWQVFALWPDGTRSAGPVWRLNAADLPGWRAEPAVLTNGVLLNAGNPAFSLDNPAMLAAVTCGLISAGLGLILVAAWWLGIRAERRTFEAE